MDNGLIEILRISRIELKDLNMSDSCITGIGVKEGVKALPNLATLKLSHCFNLANEGLVEILSISGRE